MNRIIHVLLFSVVAFLGFAAPAFADKIPVVLDTEDIEQKSTVSFQLPEGSFDCTGSANGTSNTVSLVVEHLYDPEGLSIRTTQVQGNCQQARDDVIVLSHLELGLKSATIRLGAQKDWTLLVEFDKPLPNEPRLGHLLRAAVGGRAGIVLGDPVCDQHSCKFTAENADQLLVQLPKLSGAQVSAFHSDSFSSALTKDGKRVSPKLVNVEWVTPRAVASDVRVIPPSANQAAFVIEDRAYRIFMNTGVVECKDKERIIKACATVSRTSEKSYRVEITDAGALRALRDQASVEVLIPSASGLKVEEDQASIATFSIEVAFKTCAYDIKQVEHATVYRGMQMMKVLLEISSVDGQGCDATDGWVVKSAAPNDLDVVRGLTQKGNSYVLDAKTSMGRSSTVKLEFFYDNGLPVQTKAPVTVELKERKSFESFNVSVYSGKACGAKGDRLDSVSKKTQALARGHANVIVFDDVNSNDLEGWFIDRTTHKPKETGSDNKLSDRTTKTTKEDFCIDRVAESADATRLRFQYRVKGELLGEAEEVLTLSQHDLAIKQSLPSWIRLVCEDSISDSTRSGILANRAGSLRRCNLLFELEDGAFAKLEKDDYTRYSQKGTPTRGETGSKLPDACGSNPSSAGDASYSSFIEKWGEQELILKLWSPGDDGEFVEANGIDGTTIYLGSTIKNIDAGPYTTTVAGEVLAVCVDLTYAGAIGGHAYDIIKLSVEYSDGHYAANWREGGFDAPFEAKRRRMPRLGWKYRSSSFGPRMFFSLAVPTLIRVPATGVDQEMSSEFRRASTVAFEAGVLVGLEWWNFDENSPLIPAFAPQLYAGIMFLGIPTQDNPRVLRPSGVLGVGFRIPTGAPTAKPVQGSTSLIVWAEFSESARHELAVSALLGFKVELGIFGG
jgi:hypothetical protein